MAIQHTVTFSFKDTPIQAGEYGAAFGHGRKPVDLIKIYLFMGKHMAIEQETATSMRIAYLGKLPKRSQDGIDYMIRTGLIQRCQEPEQEQIVSGECVECGRFSLRLSINGSCEGCVMQAAMDAMRY